MDLGGSRRRNLLLALAAVAVAAAVVIGIVQSPDGVQSTASNPESAATEEDFEAALADAPPELAAIYDQGDALIEGGVEALERQLAEIRGTPAVVNAWASWCGPCRFEFPHFQRAAMEHGTEVAFLGVDVEDAVEAAEGFLERLPLPYPSFVDGDGEIRKVWKARSSLPITAFYDSSGELVHLREGQYRSEEELEADIARYAR